MILLALLAILGFTVLVIKKPTSSTASRQPGMSLLPTSATPFNFGRPDAYPTSQDVRAQTNQGSGGGGPLVFNPPDKGTQAPNTGFGPSPGSPGGAGGGGGQVFGSGGGRTRTYV